MSMGMDGHMGSERTAYINRSDSKYIHAYAAPQDSEKYFYLSVQFNRD